MKLQLSSFLHLPRRWRSARQSDALFSQEISPPLIMRFLFNLFSLKRPAYEEHVHAAISQGRVLNTSPCSLDFKTTRRGSANVLYIKMKDAKDTETWLQVAKCFHIWDLDARGYHRGMWRMIYKGNPLFIVGVPYSDYA